jgi:hypothetical protein
MLQQDERIMDHHIELHGLPGWRLLPGQGEKALHHIATAVNRLLEYFHIDIRRPRTDSPRFMQVVERHCGHGQRIVELMSHMSQQSAQGGELLALQQRLSHALLLRHLVTQLVMGL